MAAIFGVGVNDYDGPVTRKTGEGKVTPLTFYSVWRGMLRRCYSKVGRDERWSTYECCTVHPDWFSLTNFKAWFDDNYVEGYDLDKDLLKPDNKIYGPDTCVFIPPRLNTAVQERRSTSGEMPVGVSKKGLRFAAHISKNGKRHWIGVFDSVEEAAAAYRKEKNDYVVSLVVMYKDSLPEHFVEAMLKRYAN